MNKAIADKHAGAACTLDGKPAKVTGRLNQFATVARLDCRGAVDYSWPAVARIMEQGGRFIS